MFSVKNPTLPLDGVNLSFTSTKKDGLLAGFAAPIFFNRLGMAKNSALLLEDGLSAGFAAHTVVGPGKF